MGVPSDIWTLHEIWMYVLPSVLCIKRMARSVSDPVQESWQTVYLKRNLWNVKIRQKRWFVHLPRQRRESNDPVDR